MKILNDDTTGQRSKTSLFFAVLFFLACFVLLSATVKMFYFGQPLPEGTEQLFFFVTALFGIIGGQYSVKRFHERTNGKKVKGK